jgi:hypothetical protein
MERMRRCPCGGVLAQNKRFKFFWDCNKCPNRKIYLWLFANLYLFNSEDNNQDESMSCLLSSNRLYQRCPDCDGMKYWCIICKGEARREKTMTQDE